MKKNLLILLIIIFSTNIFSQLSDPPKREFRSAWVATVANLDWPPVNATPAAQRQALINILDFLYTHGINVVIFQIRTECDALYQSNYEPWSYYLTGAQGTPPNPFYDPLQFAIEEAHKRGMELHAWFNPYRAIRIGANYPKASNHVSNLHPDWLIASRKEVGYHFLNPGKQVVRNYVTNVIMDVVRRYDVDGIHMDDYFYPYGGMVTEDIQTFLDEPRQFTSFNPDSGNWRRDNVNLLIKQVNDSVSAVKPHVKFGMSPFGIWKNGVPPGIIGLDAYNVIYADAMAWLGNQSVDYLTPQLYWRIGGNQDYLKLSAWWGDSTFKHNRHLYPGQAPYRITDPNQNWSASELPNQIRINRSNPKIQGSVFFRANTMTGKGFNDSLKNDLYRFKALPPAMPWKDAVNPNPVQNLRFERLSPTEPYALIWDKPATASDGDSAYRYVVYRFTTPNVTQADLNDPANILVIEPKRNSIPPLPPTTGPYFFVVTALDRNWNESIMSTVVQIGGPQVPQQVIPSNGAINIRDTVTLRWATADLASSYSLQISGNPAFADDFIVNGIEVFDTAYTATGFEGEKTYYWRLYSKNAGGISSYSEAFSFTTGFPKAPIPANPPHGAVSQPINLNLSWLTNDNTINYGIQVATANNFAAGTVVAEASGLTDTTFNLSDLDYNRIYYWRVNSVNQFGTSQWSARFGFRTELATGLEYEESNPTDYILAQNFPNPFNPSTQIKFSLPESGYTTLKVFDTIGNEIAELVNEDIPAGKYTINFNAAHLSSGIYIYILRSGGKMMSNKMVYIK
jgi:uncharacterized lipoprotein YddW (UPF0748 family)